MDSLRALKPYNVTFCVTKYSLGHAVVFAQSKQAALELAKEMSPEDIDDLEPTDGDLWVEDVEPLEGDEMEEQNNG